MRTRWLSIAALVVVAAACGGSDGDSTGGATGAPAGTAPPATEPAETAAADDASGGVCPAEPFTGTIERTGESDTGDGVHVVASRTDAQLVAAYAYDFGTGDTYTVYVGDFEIDEAAVGRDTLTAPAGGLLATIFLQSETELAPGTTLDFGFVPIVDTGGGATITGFGADEVDGTATIIAVTDGVLCFDIDASDPQQELRGTVSARIVG